MKLKREAKFTVANVDVHDGEVIEILDGGRFIETNYGQILCFTVKTEAGKDSLLRFNKGSSNACIAAWGDDTEQWVGRRAKLGFRTLRVGISMSVIPIPE